MSKCPKCPNCGLVNPDELRSDLWWCGECGTAFDWSADNPGYDAEQVSVPRRSEPAEVYEEPDPDIAMCWSEEINGKLLTWFVPEPRGDEWLTAYGKYGQRYFPTKGKWYPWTPPIVPPLVKPPAKDPDAEWLRMISSRDPDNWASVSIRLARIADRLADLRSKLEMAEKALKNISGWGRHGSKYCACDRCRAQAVCDNALDAMKGEA